MTERRRRPHPALGGRWLAFGLATSTTVGMTGYLAVQGAASAAAAHDGGSTVPVVAPAVGAPVVPPAPSIVVVTVPPPAAVSTPAVPAPQVTAAPRATAPVVTAPHARTRGSNP